MNQFFLIEITILEQAIYSGQIHYFIIFTKTPTLRKHLNINFHNACERKFIVPSSHIFHHSHYNVLPPLPPDCSKRGGNVLCAKCWFRTFLHPKTSLPSFTRDEPPASRMHLFYELFSGDAYLCPERKERAASSRIDPDKWSKLSSWHSFTLGAGADRLQALCTQPGPERSLATSTSVNTHKFCSSIHARSVSPGWAVPISIRFDLSPRGWPPYDVCSVVFFSFIIAVEPPNALQRPSHCMH